MAAVLASGKDAALGYESGGALYGFADDDPREIHVVVPASRHPRHPGIRPHRRIVMPPVTTVDGIPVVDPLSVLLDLAVSRSPGQIATLVNEADKLGLIRVDEALGESRSCGGAQASASSARSSPVTK